MISRKQAEELVHKHLEKLCANVPGGVAILEENTIEKPYGWIFFFNAKRFIETRDPLESLGGNSPLLVEAKDGRITPLGTARPVSESIRRLESERGLLANKTE